MDIKKIVGRKIAKERNKQGLTQEDLAELTGFQSSYISKVERGVVSIGIVNLEKMCDSLKISIEFSFKKKA